MNNKRIYAMPNLVKTINITETDKATISSIVYEVVNYKAARAEDQDKRAPKPKTRKSRKQKEQP